MKKTILFVLTLLAVFRFTSFQVFSAGTTTCQPVYGGGQTCITSENLLVNKTVLNPKTNQMVKNLSVNDPKYAPENIVTFHVTVKNTSSTSLSNIEVKDILPQYIQFVTGTGNFDNNSKTLSFKIDSLAQNESKTYTIQGKVVPANQFPIDQGTVCVVNQVTATVNSQTSSDNSQFCIEKKVLAAAIPPVTKGGKPVFPAPTVTTTPPTGPELIPLLALIPSGIVGFVLRKKSIKTGGVA